MTEAMQKFDTYKASTGKKLLSFHVKHTDREGICHEYDCIAPCSTDAAKDCVKTFGIGRIKVVANNPDIEPEAA